MNYSILFLVFALVSITTGCGSAEVRGTFLSGEKNIWISDPSSLDVSFCESNSDGAKADPICYPARKPSSAELHSQRRGYTAPVVSEPAAPAPILLTPATGTSNSSSTKEKSKE